MAKYDPSPDYLELLYGSDPSIMPIGYLDSKRTREKWRGWMRRWLNAKSQSEIYTILSERGVLSYNKRRTGLTDYMLYLNKKNRKKFETIFELERM